MKCLYSETIDLSIKNPVHGSSGILEDSEGVVFNGQMADKLRSTIHFMLTPLTKQSAAVRREGVDPEALICFRLTAAKIRRNWVQYIKAMYAAATKKAHASANTLAEKLYVSDGYASIVAFEIHRALFFEKSYMLYDDHAAQERKIIYLPSVAGLYIILYLL